MICYVGMGSNLGDSKRIFENVLYDLESNPRIELREVSSFYQTRPLDNAHQPDYLNAVICLETALAAHDLLDLLQELEKKYGRVRSAERWQSRTLDLDILLFGDQIIVNERLTIPHREMCKRDFVLFPLYEIAPELFIPGQGALKKLMSQCENRGIRKL